MSSIHACHSYQRDKLFVSNSLSDYTCSVDFGAWFEFTHDAKNFPEQVFITLFIHIHMQVHIYLVRVGLTQAYPS